MSRPDKEFLAQHMNQPAPMSDTDRRLDELARRYYEQCEAYDRSVCTGPIRDGFIAAGSNDELVKSNRHALKLLRATMAEAASLGATEKEFKEARARVRAQLLRRGRANSPEIPDS